MKCTFCLQLIFVFILGVSTMINAKEITLHHHGKMLNADLELADGKTLANGLIFITHGALAHRDMETLKNFRALFNDLGFSTFSINLSLGINNRHNMQDCNAEQRHKNNDAVAEISHWLAWLKKEGAKNVTLLGHSRGGAQTALYQKEHENNIVNAMVLLAPATKDNSDTEHYKHRYNKDLESILTKARNLVAAGKGNSILKSIGFMTCRETDVSAQSFLSYYANQSRVDTPALLKSTNTPTLVVVAGNDKIVVGLDKKIAPLQHNKNIKMTIIDGSNHMFRDLNADDAVDSIVEFIEGLN